MALADLRPLSPTEVVDAGVELCRRHPNEFFLVTGPFVATTVGLLVLIESVTTGLLGLRLVVGAAGTALAVCAAIAMAGSLVIGRAEPPKILVRRTASDAGALLAIVGLTAPALVLLFPAARLVAMAPVRILERAGVGAAARRSWHLTRLRAGAAVGTGLVLGGLIAAAYLSVDLIVRTLVLAEFVAGSPAAALQVGIVRVLVAGAVVPVAGAVIALTYVDLRVRREALDLRLFGGTPAPAAAVGSGPVRRSP